MNLEVVDDRYPHSSRIRTRQAILDKLGSAAGPRALTAGEGVCAAARHAAPAPRSPVNRYTGPPATLGSTAAAGMRLIVWCRDCRHQVEPDPAATAERHGAETSIPDWHQRLVCGQCGSRQIDFVVTGDKR
jgi:hypothetical protein